MNEKQKDWTDKNWNEMSDIEKIKAIFSTIIVFIVIGSLIWAFLNSDYIKYYKPVNHMMFDESVDTIKRFLVANDCKDIEIPKYKKKYIYHSGRGEWTEKYNNATGKEGKQFYEYCTVSFPVKFCEINGKEKKEEMTIEFDVFQPDAVTRNLNDIEKDEFHVVNLTKERLEDIEE